MLRDELSSDEGERLKVYDDATGEPIGPGSVVKGHPTIGIGRALDTDGITRAESAFLLSNNAEVVQAQANQAFFWYDKLSVERKVVILSMLFQIGLGGVKGFKNFLTAMGVADYDTAKKEMLDSLWAKETPARALRLATQLATGENQLKG